MNIIFCVKTTTSSHQKPAWCHSCTTTRTRKFFFLPTTNLHLPYWSPDHKKNCFWTWEHFFLIFFSGPILPTTPHSSRTSTPKGWKKIFVASSQPTSIILTAWAWKGTTLGPGNIFFYFFFDPESPSKSLFDVAKIQKAPRGSKYSIHLAFGYVWWHSRLGLVRFRQNPPSTHWFLRPESPSRSCFDASKIQNAPRGSKSTLEGCSWPIGTRTDWICLGRHSSWLYKGLNWCWFRFCCLLDSIFFRWDWWIDHCMMGQMLILFLWDLFEPGRYLGGRTRNYNFHD